MNQITEKTWVPLSLFGAIGSVSIGGIIWLTTMYNQGVANASAISSMEVRHEVLRDGLSEKLDVIHRDIVKLQTEIKQLHK